MTLEAMELTLVAKIGDKNAHILNDFVEKCAKQILETPTISTENIKELQESIIKCYPVFNPHNKGMLDLFHHFLRPALVTNLEGFEKTEGITCNDIALSLAFLSNRFLKTDFKVEDFNGKDANIRFTNTNDVSIWDDTGYFNHLWVNTNEVPVVLYPSKPTKASLESVSEEDIYVLGGQAWGIGIFDS